MVLLLQGAISYTPNEPDLAITGLQAYATKLNDLNSKAATADANLKAARIDRNTFFYAEDTGVLDLVKKSKAYVLGIYGRNSPQHNAALSYKFSKSRA